MNKIKKSIISDLLIIAVVALVPCCSFVIRNGLSIIPVITELNVSPSFFLSNLFYNWHPYYEAGFDNSPSAWFVFPLGALFTALSSVGIESSMISIFFIFLVYCLHGVSMYYLMYTIGKIEAPLPRFSKMIAAFFYMFNPFTLLYIHELGSQQLLASAILPLLLACMAQGLFKKNLSYSVYIGLISICAGANITFFVIILFVLLAYILYDLVMSHRNDFLWKCTFAGVTLVIIFAANLFWLLPRLSNIISEINLAFREGESVSRSIILNSMSSSYYETFRLMGSWSFQPAYFSYYLQYYSSIIIASTFAAPIFAMTTLILKPRKKLEIFAILMVIICIPLAVAAYPPSNPHLTGIIYQWLYQNLPFFIIFRGAYKFVMVIALSYSILIGLSWAKLHEIRFLKIKGRFLSFIGLGLILLLLLGSSPSFYGQMVENRGTFSIPQYYYEAREWLWSQGKDFRIMTIPEMRHVQYEWDGETRFTGTDISVPIFKIPIIGRSYYLSLGSPATDEVTHQLYRMIIANQTQNLAHALKILNAKYIMIHGDYKWSALEWNPSPSYLINILNEAPNITLVKNFGELQFFENELWSDSTAFVYDLPADNNSQSIFACAVSDFDPEINESTSNWKIEDGVFISNDWYNYNDDVILNKNGYTNLTLTFKAKSLNGYLHIYFFAMNEKNAYRLWLSGMQYELGKITDGKFTIIKSQYHLLSLNISTWNFYEIEFNEGNVNVAVNGNSFDIDYEDRNYIAGKIGFASPTNIVHIGEIKLKYLSTKIDLSSIRSCSYVQINPTKYVVSLQNISTPVLLVLTNSFHEGWNAYSEENTSARIQHVVSFNYANGWYINQSGELTLEYVPQRLYGLEFKVWLLIITGFIVYLSYSYSKAKHLLKRLKQQLSPHRNN